jgi:hypothetical protein
MCEYAFTLHHFLFTNYISQNIIISKSIYYSNQDSEPAHDASKITYISFIIFEIMIVIVF